MRHKQNIVFYDGNLFTVFLKHVMQVMSNSDILYKYLFTENTVATQKHSSASINTNKAKTTTKSITVVDTWYWIIDKILYTRIIIFVHQT